MLKTGDRLSTSEKIFLSTWEVQRLQGSRWAKPTPTCRLPVSGAPRQVVRPLNWRENWHEQPGGAQEWGLVCSRQDTSSSCSTSVVQGCEAFGGGMLWNILYVLCLINVCQYGLDNTRHTT